MTISSFNPPLRTLMGPGPSDVHPRVLAAMARPTVGHLDPDFIGMMDEVKSLLQYVFQTDNALTFPISAPGSAGMECCFANLVEPGDKVIVCINGVFGLRMKENVERCGGVAIVVEDDWGCPVDAHKVEDALKANPDTKIVAFVQAETSIGVHTDPLILCKLATRYGALSIVDAVTALAGVPVLVDDWGADAVYAGTQKCLSCVPGLSPVTFSERALDKIRNRTAKVQSWFLDLNLIMGYWGEGATRSYHHTAPVNALYALHESLVMVQEEGLENAWHRHAKMHLGLKAGLEAMGLEFMVNEIDRLPQLNAVKIPDGVDDGALRKQALERYGLEIGAGLGAFAGKVWRVGLMGQSATPRHILLCLSTLETLLSQANVKIESGKAVDAAQKILF
ncbi:MAG: pyridoxal-phosphate-dependent aminotransferase family protein [Terasakiella sp.]|uniref:pyridoxal-phosphate-dependent aminotransferase family protein n=1 Tax=unclassified Terasakiella TaxID=2614952 RepID=UPI003B00A126